MEVEEELCLLASVRELYRPGITDMRALLTNELDRVVAHAKDTAVARVLSCKPEQITVEAAEAFLRAHGIGTAGGAAARGAEAKPTSGVTDRTESVVEDNAETGMAAEPRARGATLSDAEAESETQQEEATQRARTSRAGRPRRTSSAPSADEDAPHSSTATGKRPIADTGVEPAPPGEDGTGPTTTIESSPIKRPRRSARK